MAQFTFRSSARRYRLYFPPEIYGSIETQLPMTDANGNAVIDTEGRSIKKKIPVPVAKFEDHMLTLDDSDPLQARQLAALRLRIDKGHEDGSLAPGDLEEEDPNVTNAVNFGDGAVIVSVPEGPLPKEASDLIYGTENGPGLLTYFINPLPKPALNGAFDLLDRSLAYFEVQGIVSPTKERAAKLLRPRIIDLVYALHDAGLPLLGADSKPLGLQSKSA